MKNRRKFDWERLFWTLWAISFACIGTAVMARDCARDEACGPCPNGYQRHCGELVCVEQGWVRQ